MPSSTPDPPALGTHVQPAPGPSPSPPDAAVKPWLGLQLIGFALLAWLAGAFYTLHLNPEIIFFKRIALLKQDWARRVTRQFPHKTVFCGGSSCTFSIDPERLEQQGLPAANLALGAGMGLHVLTRFALEEVRPGDTLILSVEPPVLLSRTDATMLGAQLSFALHEPQWLAEGNDVAAKHVAWASALLMLRPGGYHVFTLAGKLLSRKPIYRYQTREVRPSGWQQSPLHLPLAPWAGSEGTLPASTRAFLQSLRRWCDARQVRLAYSLPWTYTDAAHASELRRRNVQLLQQISTLLPALKDPHLGIQTNAADFADTVWHLNTRAAHDRTDEVARELKAWDRWRPEELQALEGTVTP